jgi:lysophospholipase L1-like esterase
VIVLGLDGVDPDIVELLISEGQLPNFAKLQDAGAHARLLSSEPLLSPILWTTIATGKTPDQHGITSFVAVNEKTGQQLPVTSQMRRNKALWNVVSDLGRGVAVVGWWATWPAEAVNGTIVSDHTAYHFLFPEGQTGAKDSIGAAHPPEFQDVVDRLIRRPESLTASDLEPFVKVSEEELGRSFDFDDPLGHFKWAFATAQSYRDIGLHIWREQAPNVLLVYVEGVDSSSHLFGHLFRAEGLAGELAAQQERFGSTVEEMYRYADRIVLPYRPRIIVLYAGENDLSGWSGTTPESVAGEFGRFVDLVHRELPETRIIYLAIKPSLLRKGLAEEQLRTNELIMKQAAADDRLEYLDLTTCLLDDAGQLRPELFRWDRLHLNDEGYRLWTAALKPRLEEEWAAIGEKPPEP